MFNVNPNAECGGSGVWCVVWGCVVHGLTRKSGVRPSYRCTPHSATCTPAPCTLGHTQNGTKHRAERGHFQAAEYVIWAEWAYDFQQEGFAQLCLFLIQFFLE